MREYDVPTKMGKTVTAVAAMYGGSFVGSGAKEMNSCAWVKHARALDIIIPPYKWQQFRANLQAQCLAGRVPMPELNSFWGLKFTDPETGFSVDVFPHTHEALEAQTGVSTPHFYLGTL